MLSSSAPDIIRSWSKICLNNAKDAGLLKWDGKGAKTSNNTISMMRNGLWAKTNFSAKTYLTCRTDCVSGHQDTALDLWTKKVLYCWQRLELPEVITKYPSNKTGSSSTNISTNWHQKSHDPTPNFHTKNERSSTKIIWLSTKAQARKGWFFIVKGQPDRAINKGFN